MPKKKPKSKPENTEDYIFAPVEEEEEVLPQIFYDMDGNPFRPGKMALEFDLATEWED